MKSPATVHDPLIPHRHDVNDAPAGQEGKEEARGVVFNIMRYSVHDGPGIRTTVFLKGCPLHCAWCHNPESLSVHPRLVTRPDRCLRCGACLRTCQHGAVSSAEEGYRTSAERCVGCGRCVEGCAPDGRELVGREMTVSGLLHDVERDRVFFEESGGGVTLSGGEPLLQHRFLVPFLAACMHHGLHTVVDTTGYAPADVVRRVSEFTDLFLYDLKIMDSLRHREYTGVTNNRILSNLRLLSSLNKRIIVRIPLIPGINDGAENIEETGKFIASLGAVSAVHLLPYHAIAADKYERLGMTYRLGEVVPPSPERMRQIAEQLGQYHADIILGG